MSASRAPRAAESEGHSSDAVLPSEMLRVGMNLGHSSLITPLFLKFRISSVANLNLLAHAKPNDVTCPARGPSQSCVFIITGVRSMLQCGCVQVQVIDPTEECASEDATCAGKRMHPDVSS